MNYTIPTVALFASGTGSLFPGFFMIEEQDPEFVVSCVVVSKECKAAERAREAGKPVLVCDAANESVINFLDQYNVGLICLAGYLKIIPSDFISAFKGKIINSHPSLLPKFGGKGMHGDNVHKAVIEAGETQTGFTVHEVTPIIDDGPILFQKSVEITPSETWESVKEKVIEIEQQYYPEVAVNLIRATKHS